MAVLILVLLVAVPIIEVTAFAFVAGHLGFFAAAALLLLISIGGIALVKREGLGAWRRAQDLLRAGEVPATDLLNGLLILVAGVLIAVPGFVTDALGLLLLVPPVRALVRTVAFGRFERRLRATTVTAPGGVAFGSTSGSRLFTGPATYGVVDVSEVDPDHATDRARRHGGAGELEP